MFCSVFHLNAYAEKVEVVQSVPMETNLDVRGARETQSVWLEMIQGAKRTIDIEQFYISDQVNEALSPVLKSIESAAARGVAVRLIVDAQFLKTYPNSYSELAHTSGIQAKIISFSARHGIQHAKYFVVDGKDSFVGSQNFDWRAISHIHEMGLRVSDEAVGAQLESLFNKDWGKSNSLRRGSKLQTSHVRVVASPPDLNPAGIGTSLDAILSLIASAKSSVRIQVMDYSTKAAGAAWCTLDSALRAAAKRGAKVELMVDSGHAVKAMPTLRSLASVSGISVRSVTIPPWSGGDIPFARLIHSKYMIIDNSASWIGAENWSQDYFMNSRNVGLITDLPDTLALLSAVYEKLWSSSYGATISSAVDRAGCK